MSVKTHSDDNRDIPGRGVFFFWNNNPLNLGEPISNHFEMGSRSRKNWFRRNGTTYEPNKRKAFDDPGSYEEAADNEVSAAQAEFYNWYPKTQWVIYMRGLGECGDGTNAEQAQVARDDFDAKLGIKSFPKRKAKNGQYMLGVWIGGQDQNVETQRRTKRWKRDKRIVDTVAPE